MRKDKTVGQPPREVGAKAAEAVVLLDRQYLLTCHLIKTRASVLTEFEQAINAKEQSLKHVLDAFNYVFALIDNLVRYQKIASSLPILSQKRAECRALDSAMGALKDVRNQLQHINNDIDNEYSGPLLGAVCWVSDTSQFIASFHDVSRPRSTPGIVFDTQKGQYVHEFVYVYNEVYHDLGKAIAGMHAFQSFVKQSFKVQMDGKPYDPNNHFVAACVSFHPSH